MDVVKVKEHVDYSTLYDYIKGYSDLFEETDNELKTVLSWVPPDEKPSIERIRARVQTCAVLYLATLEEMLDRVDKGD